MNVYLFTALLISFVLIFLMPIVSIKAYRYGLSDCSKLLNKREIIEEKVEESAREPTEAEIIARNIENYSGDGRGQIEIENTGGNI